MEHVFKLFEFNVYNDKASSDESSNSDDETNVYKDKTKFVIQTIFKFPNSLNRIYTW